MVTGSSDNVFFARYLDQAPTQSSTDGVGTQLTRWLGSLGYLRGGRLELRRRAEARR